MLTAQGQPVQAAGGWWGSALPPCPPAAQTLGAGAWLCEREVPADGAGLEQQLAAELLALSPKLRQVAQYCLQHARHLHRYRIQDVATQCDTQPVTVVRLAKRYGFRGFLDFKMAFLVQAPQAIPAIPATTPPNKPARTTPTDRLGAVLSHHASASLAQHQQGLSQLEDDWNGQAFCKAVALLKRARRVWMHASTAVLPMAQCHAALLQAAGQTVRWTPAQGDAFAKRDVLLLWSLDCDSDAMQNAVARARHLGVPVLALTDQRHGWLAACADAHLCIAGLGQGAAALCAAMLLTHAMA